MTVYSVSVIIIIFLLILLTPLEIRLTVKEKLTVTISGVFLSLELSRFLKDKRKKKKAPSFPALFNSLKFFLKHARITVYNLPATPPISAPTFGIYRMLISLLFAYSNKNTGKLVLPDSSDAIKEAYPDVSFKVGLWVLGFVSINYIVRKATGRLKRVRE